MVSGDWSVRAAFLGGHAEARKFFEFEADADAELETAAQAQTGFDTASNFSDFSTSRHWHRHFQCAEKRG